MKQLLLNCLLYVQTFLKIIDKKGRTVPFLLNEPQKKLYEIIKEQWNQGKPVRVIILKARQMGFSTLTGAIIFWMAATAYYVRCMIVAHKEDATNNLFQMYRRFYDNLPQKIKPMLQASNAQELVFDRPTRYRGTSKGLGSRIRCATAGGQGVGRSFTLKALHLSEVAFWPGNKADTLLGLLQAVPEEPGTMIIIESTPNGYEEFKNRWDAAVDAYRRDEEGYIPVFFAWFEMQEYRRKTPKNFVKTEEEKAIARTFGLDDEQIAWRRWAIQNLCGGDLNKFHQEYPATPDEAFIATGKCVFDKEMLVLRRTQVEKDPWERGSFRIKYSITEKIESYVWAPDRKGIIRILKKPEKGVPYVLGGDTAGTGNKSVDPDFFAGQVLDNRTGEQVAVLHERLDEREYAEQMYCLGKYYNNALIGVEINYSTYPEKKLEELGYKNLYVRQHVDNYTQKVMESFGFETNLKTRPLIIDGLKDVFRYTPELITDFDTLGEMLTFIYAQGRRPEAEQGEHDDLVMALAIAHFIRSQQRTSVRLEEAEGTAVWTEDMWNDYQRGSAADRELMIRLWGRPRREAEV